jgi:hypothetical protein
MRLVIALAVLGGCGANLINAGGDEDAGVDATGRRPDASAVDAAVDAPIDARACIDGDARTIAPDGSCLILINAPQSFADGRVTCAGLGAHVAILSTAALDAAAEALVGARDTFIGLTDEVTEGQFIWVDGTLLGFSNWELGEPNDGNGSTSEDCAIIAGTRPAKGWDDRPCAPVASGGLYSVLCQR